MKSTNIVSNNNTTLGKTYNHLIQDLTKQFPSLNEIGNSPIVKVLDDNKGGGIYAKIEWENLSGSIKDRVALSMVANEISNFSSFEKAQQQLHLLEYSGGSLAFSLAKICNIMGISLTMVVGDWLPQSALASLKSQCQELFVTPKEKGFYEVIVVARKLAIQNSKYTFLNQHENLSCIDGHRQTGIEILQYFSDEKIDSWVAAIGTGATLMGVSSALKEKHPKLTINGVSPSEQPYATLLPPNGKPKIVGTGGLGNGLLQFFVDKAFDTFTVNKHWEVSFEEAILATKKIHTDTGLWVGSSAAANYLVAYEEHLRLGIGSKVVTVFPSASSLEQCNNYPIAEAADTPYSYII